MIVKLLGNTETIGTSNTDIGGARLVRLLNTGTTPALIFQFDTAANTQIGTLVLAASAEASVEKFPSDALTSNNASNVLGVSVAFTH
jgi:hypothetical protein